MSSMSQMSRNVTLIDYGAGNLLNVQRAFEHQGATVDIATRPEQIEQAERLVFPGWGVSGSDAAITGSRPGGSDSTGSQ